MTTSTYEHEDRHTDAEVMAALATLEIWDDLVLAGGAEPVHAGVVDVAVTRVRAASAADGPGVPARSHRRRWQLTAVAAGLVAAVTAAVVVVPTLGDTPAQRAEAAQLLDRAAAAVTPDPVARPDQWWRVVSSGRAISVASGEQTSPQRLYWVSETDIRYRAVDASRPTYVDTGARRYLSQVAGPTGALPAPDPGAVLLEPPAGQDGDTWTSPTPSWLAGLPRDPRALRDLLSRAAGQETGGDDATALLNAAALLESGVAPADLRSAVLSALAEIGGGLEVETGVVIAGRTGVAIGLTRVERRDTSTRADTPAAGRTVQLVIGPDDGQLLGYREITVGETGLGVPDGTVVAETVVSRSLVDTVPERVRNAAAVP